MNISFEPFAGGMAKESVFTHSYRVCEYDMEDMPSSLNIEPKGEWIIDFGRKEIILGFKKIEVLRIDWQSFGKF